MTEKISCGIARDLMPLYAEKLTGEESNAAVEQHVSECEPCREVLESMTAKEPEEKEEQKREIDFLRAARRATIGKIALAVVGAVALLIGALALKTFVIGSKADPSQIRCNAEVDGAELTVDCRMMYGGIARVNFDEEDGCVNVSVISAEGKDSAKTAEYTASEPIREVRVGDRIVWNKEKISDYASEIYNAVTPYVGNNVAVYEAIYTVGVLGELGSTYNITMETAAEPYGLIITMFDGVTLTPEKAEKIMANDGALLIAMIGNLDHVTWQYTIGGERMEYTVTREDATAAAGADIKSFSQSAYDIQKLLRALGCDKKGAAGDSQLYMYDACDIFITMDIADIPIYGISHAEYVNGELFGSGGMMHADNTPLRVGDMESVSVTLYDYDETVVYISIMDDFEEPIQRFKVEGVELQKGRTYFFTLTGEKGNYRLIAD